MEGHRSRLRALFVKGDKSALSEETLLELLLTYAIPRKDVKPLAKELLKKFGSLNLLLKAEMEDLAAVEGVGKQTTILLKLVERIHNAIPLEVEEKRADILASAKPQLQLPLRSVTKESFRNQMSPKSLLKRQIVGGEIVAGLLAAGPLLAQGHGLFLGAAAVTVGATTLAASYKRRKHFPDRFPAAFFMNIEKKQ